LLLHLDLNQFASPRCFSLFRCSIWARAIDDVCSGGRRACSLDCSSARESPSLSKRRRAGTRRDTISNPAGGPSGGCSEGRRRGRRSLTLKEVAAAPLVLPSRPSTIRQRVETALMDAQLTCQFAGEVSATDMLVRVVRAGIGWTLLPWSAVADDINRGDMVALPIRNLRLRRELAICVSDTLPLSNAAQLVKDSIAEITKHLVSSRQWMRVEAVSSR
jgi:LysR substrate binding domain